MEASENLRKTANKRVLSESTGTRDPVYRLLEVMRSLEKNEDYDGDHYLSLESTKGFRCACGRIFKTEDDFARHVDSFYESDESFRQRWDDA